MKIITEPTVDLVWAPRFIRNPAFPIPEDGDTATKIGAFAAKTCYQSFGADGRPNAVNQEHIISSGHGRILEHMVYGLYISGISRALGNELITHKPGVTVSQRSTRFVDEKNAGFVLEPYLAAIYKLHYEEGIIDKDCEECQTLLSQLNSAQQDFCAYEKQVELLIRLNPEQLTGTSLRKWARGKARNSLPLGLETAMVVTANLRAWRNFIEMRSHRSAELEIRRLTALIFTVLNWEAPLYFADYKMEIVDGFPEYTTPYRKV